MNRKRGNSIPTFQRTYYIKPQKSYQNPQFIAHDFLNHNSCLKSAPIIAGGTMAFVVFTTRVLARIEQQVCMSASACAAINYTSIYARYEAHVF
jgi:hypothetical protein